MKNEITIAIPVYERFDFFPEVMNCAINQTKSCRVIVVDNHSSHDKFKNYVEDLHLENVKYYKNDSNLEMTGNWNKCIDYTETGWMTILHDDDLLSLQFVEQVSALINNHPDAISIVTGYEKTDKPKLILEKKTTEFEVKRVKPFHFLFGNITGFVGVIFNKSKIGDMKFIPSLYPVSDYDFWYKMSLMEPTYYLTQVLSFYRVSPIQDSATAYKKVIECVYFFRKDIIHFRNFIFKFFSLFELYKLDQRYRRDYQVRQAVTYEIKDLNKYFSLFSNKYVEYFIRRFVYRRFKKIFGIHTGY